MWCGTLQALYTQSQAQFGAYVATGTLLNNYGEDACAARGGGRLVCRSSWQ